MNIKKWQTYTILSLLSLLAFASCELFEEDDSVSIEERIEKFEGHVNDGDDSKISDDFHSEMESKLQTQWYGIFVGGPLGSNNTPVNFGKPSSISDGSESDEKIAQGVMINDNDVSLTYVMTMKEESEGNGVWMIKTLELNGTDYLSGEGPQP